MITIKAEGQVVPRSIIEIKGNEVHVFNLKEGWSKFFIVMNKVGKIFLISLGVAAVVFLVWMFIMGLFQEPGTFSLSRAWTDFVSWLLK